MNKEKSGLIAIVALVLSIAALVMCYICCQQQKKDNSRSGKPVFLLFSFFLLSG